MNVIASRYASALFALASDATSLDKVADELTQLSNAYQGSEDLRRVAASPLVSRDSKVEAMSAIAEKMALSPLSVKFIRTVTEQGRLTALPAVANHYNEQLRAHNGAITAKVTTADKLSAGQRKKIQDMLASSTGKTVEVDAQVNPDMLGGMIIRLGSTMIDASLTHRLTSLQRRLKRVATA